MKTLEAFLQWLLGRRPLGVVSLAVCVVTIVTTTADAGEKRPKPTKPTPTLEHRVDALEVEFERLVDLERTQSAEIRRLNSELAALKAQLAQQSRRIADLERQPSLKTSSAVTELTGVTRTVWRAEPYGWRVVEGPATRWFASENGDFAPASAGVTPRGHRE